MNLKHSLFEREAVLQGITFLGLRQARGDGATPPGALQLRGAAHLSVLALQTTI